MMKKLALKEFQLSQVTCGFALLAVHGPLMLIELIIDPRTIILVAEPNQFVVLFSCLTVLPVLLG